MPNEPPPFKGLDFEMLLGRPRAFLMHGVKSLCFSAKSSPEFLHNFKSLIASPLSCSLKFV